MDDARVVRIATQTVGESPFFFVSSLGGFSVDSFHFVGMFWVRVHLKVDRLGGVVLVNIVRVLDTFPNTANSPSGI